MELSSSNAEIVLAILQQIQNAINDLKEWNKDIKDVDDFYSSPVGMRDLAANCMIIEAIGEGFKRVDRITEGQLFLLRTEIPWHDVVGIRNRIAHGYFDIDGEMILSTIQNDLDPLLEAVDFFIRYLNESASK